MLGHALPKVSGGNGGSALCLSRWQGNTERMEGVISYREDGERVHDSPRPSNLARGALGGVARMLGSNGGGGGGFGENGISPDSRREE
jgi:hypothetical protein